MVVDLVPEAVADVDRVEVGPAGGDQVAQDGLLSLQLHDEKRETWLLQSGRAKVVWENGDGELVETELEPGRGYTCALGQRHRLVGVTDCEVIEVSTPELGTTWRLEDDYARPHETPDQRALERGGA